MDLLPHEVEEMINESIDSTVAAQLSDISAFWSSDYESGFKQLSSLAEQLVELSDVNDVEEPDEDAPGQEQLDYFVRLGIAEANRIIAAAIERFLSMQNNWESSEESLELFKDLVNSGEFEAENE